MVKRALISLSDKTGILPLAKRLREMGVEIISTGGTARHLRENGIEVTQVSDITGFPEILSGRVKTLHPIIYAGILADKSNSDHINELEAHNIQPINMVIVNLYPFEQTIRSPEVNLTKAIENIDIGGPTIIRAAAKNHKSVLVITDSEDYEHILEELSENGDVSEDTRFELAKKAFAHTARYDSIISNYFNKIHNDTLPQTLNLTFNKVQNLRYGENSHQNAAFYGIPNNFQVLHGKEISFNNLLDISTAIKMMNDFEPPSAILFKHTNPCGVGTGDDLVSAFQKAFATDTQSPFGGIFAFNRTVDMALVNEINRIFCDAIIAPDFDEDALEKLKKKKNRRLIQMEAEVKENYDFDIKRVIGGIEIQQFDEEFESEENWKVVTERTPTDDEMRALTFAWKVVKWTKSNAIVLATSDRTIGVGPGQTDRVGALEVAISKAQKYEHDLDDAVLASDAFFPFADSIQLAAAKGIRAVIQPGGSIRDQEVIDAADELGVAMVFTGRRHFRH